MASENEFCCWRNFLIKVSLSFSSLSNFEMLIRMFFSCLVRSLICFSISIYFFVSFSFSTVYIFKACSVYSRHYSSWANSALRFRSYSTLHCYFVLLTAYYVACWMLRILDSRLKHPDRHFILKLRSVLQSNLFLIGNRRVDFALLLIVIQDILSLPRYIRCKWRNPRDALLCCPQDLVYASRSLFHINLFNFSLDYFYLRIISL